MTKWRKAVDRVCQGDKPILIGPFRQEFGFEVLYWIPFVHWVRDQYKLKDDHLYVATRGGAGHFYKVPSGVELYKIRTLQEIRTANLMDWADHKSLKQVRWTPFDQELLRGAEYDLRKEFAVLAPWMMFQAFHDAWHGTGPVNPMWQSLRFMRLKPPPIQGLTLPAQYTAVRFYSRHTLPHTGMIHHWVKATIKRLCERGPVVLLEPPYVADDHLTYSVADGSGKPLSHPNLTRLREAITLEDGLAIQGHVIGKAQQFVGTYGGMQQLALLMGIPSVGYYSQWEGTLPVHLETSQRLARDADVPFAVLKMGSGEELMRKVL